MKYQDCAALFLCALVMAACNNNNGLRSAGALDKEAKRFIPKDAFNTQTAQDIPWVQISFDVQRVGNEFAFLNIEFDNAKSEGWRVCRQQASEWTKYEDVSLTQNRYIQQKVYTLYRDQVLVTLVGRYEDDREQDSQVAPQRPRVQHGIVIAKNSTDQEARETAQSLGLACS